MNRRSNQLLTASALAFTVCAVAQEKKIDRSALPPAVQKSVQAQSQGATIKGFTTEVENGRRAYEAEMMVNGRSRDIGIAPDGTVTEIEEEVAFNSLPSDVQTALTAKANGAKITKVESITKNNKLVAYEAATLKGKRHGEIQVGAHGQKLSREE